MKKCKACDKEMGATAYKCPGCGTDQRGWMARHKIWTGLIIFFGFMIIVGSLMDDVREDYQAEQETTIKTSDFPETSGYNPDSMYTVTAYSLHKHYNNNEVLADEDFKNKYAVVTGTVEEEAFRRHHI